MEQVWAAIPIVSYGFLAASEIVLIALFSVAVSVDKSDLAKIACLVLHCGTFIPLFSKYMEGGKNPRDILYIIFDAMLLIVIGYACGLIIFYFAETGSETGNIEFAPFGAGGANAVLFLSFFAFVLAISCLGFTSTALYNAYHGSDAPSVASPNHERQHRKERSRAPNINWTQRPLPLTIISVVQNGDRELPRSQSPTRANTLANSGRHARLAELEQAMGIEAPKEPKRVTFKTTYNHWPGQELEE
ncbi:hypothetical protein BDW22DRAFT_1430750 [Trametopsis cervina]|nr:hypothetical protein BDW22DRAFT_1430750 [Trametopsis cervina]